MVAQVKFADAQQEKFYNALINKDASFEGVFIAAVKTTGIFCRSTCTARKPARQNVEFFSTTKEAIVHGYRPCKVCRPLENRFETPVSIKTLIQKVADDPSARIKDVDLRKLGIDPATARRWFLKNHGITFHAYQRMYRINLAYKKLQEGDDVLSAAYRESQQQMAFICISPHFFKNRIITFIYLDKMFEVFGDTPC